MSGEAEPPSGLELPADRPRPPVASFRGATRALRLSAAVTASLRQAAERERASLDVLLLAGLAALLARYSGAEDLVIGAIGASGASGASGLLPVRLRWTGDPPFLQLVALADGALRAAVANADLPLQVLFAGPDEAPARLPSGERELSAIAELERVFREFCVLAFKRQMPLPVITIQTAGRKNAAGYRKARRGFKRSSPTRGPAPNRREKHAR